MQGGAPVCDIKGCFHVGRASSWCAVGRRIFFPKSDRVRVRTSPPIAPVVLPLPFLLFDHFSVPPFGSSSIRSVTFHARVSFRSTCVHVFSGSRQKEPSPTKLHLSAGQQREIRFSDHRGHEETLPVISELSRERKSSLLVISRQWWERRKATLPSCNKHGANLQSKEERVQHRPDIRTRQRGW